MMMITTMCSALLQQHAVIQPQDAPLDSDREADAARLDDAEATGDGISDQDFTRGKRFRKLHRVLVSTVVRAALHLDWNTWPCDVIL
jgi:phosphohistidine phosphatase SixA